jgi:hypothetical protein
MAFGKVLGGQFVNATVSINMKGELALRGQGFKRTPNLTADAVTSWKEVPDESRGGAADAIGKMGKAVSLVALPGAAGRAAAAAVGSAMESMTGAPRSVRVEWVAGGQSLIRLPDDLFLHLATLLSDLQIDSDVPLGSSGDSETGAENFTGVIGQLTSLADVVRRVPSDVTDQILKFAALRDQGVLTEKEFEAKKAELLGIDFESTPTGVPDGRRQVPPPPGSPAAWAPDPHGRHEHRYWDGTTWTDDVSNGGVLGIDPV